MLSGFLRVIIVSDNDWIRKGLMKVHHTENLYKFGAADPAVSRCSVGGLIHTRGTRISPPLEPPQLYD